MSRAAGAVLIVQMPWGGLGDVPPLPKTKAARGVE